MGTSNILKNVSDVTLDISSLLRGKVKSISKLWLAKVVVACRKKSARRNVTVA